MTTNHIKFSMTYMELPDGSLRVIQSDCNAVPTPPPSAWRDCVTDPPPTNNVVLAWYREEYILASKQEDCWMSDEGYKCYPTHWQPLPERPSE